MTRATEAFTTLAIAVTVYIVLFLGLLPLPDVIQNKIVPVFPWWALVSFGSYSLGNLGWHIMTFSDCPEAYAELMTEIQAAKADLQSKGVSL
ncbi:dolichol-phosphate mannosyltransferase subunit 3 [Radiomyces spectabilis]|uniref:dolichol-phosphate mannosyltransferase subunit 3 n=1 Tax=Radiomyces spectabilis TaxID=64574 RepID=UPI00221E86C1|nr:dolichol-phosphate mannosyltransferase subunit 3 [Radiomyces spectabilis]KAI8391471.1 dolichol-phosphate mannosyltransferase subunit 3 [Radiomyces spectabilis]